MVNTCALYIGMVQQSDMLALFYYFGTVQQSKICTGTLYFDMKQQSGILALSTLRRSGCQGRVLFTSRRNTSEIQKKYQGALNGTVLLD
jgi:hypothetical protein